MSNISASLMVSDLLVALFVVMFAFQTWKRWTAEEQRDKLQRRLVDACQEVMALRAGGGELAIKVARDFCRYNPPDYVVDTVLPEA